jgi:hypothetical protein
LEVKGGRVVTARASNKGCMEGHNMKAGCNKATDSQEVMMPTKPIKEKERKNG